MDGFQLSCDYNPLRIIEDEMPLTNKFSDNSSNDDDNKSNVSELFDFSASDTEELDGDGEVVQQLLVKQNSLIIIEDKDLTMEDTEDFNNNDSNNVHRLSLQVESGDDGSLVMTNEAINRTIIRIGSNGSNGSEFGEVDGMKMEQANEAINHEFRDVADSDNNDDSDRRNSHHTASHSSDGEVIVNILGQINDIVGLNVFASLVLFIHTLMGHPLKCLWW